MIFIYWCIQYIFIDTYINDKYFYEKNPSGCTFLQ